MPVLELWLCWASSRNSAAWGPHLYSEGHESLLAIRLLGGLSDICKVLKTALSSMC